MGAQSPTLLKLLLSVLLTNLFGDRAAGKRRTKYDKRLRKYSVTKIIVSNQYGTCSSTRDILVPSTSVPHLTILPFLSEGKFLIFKVLKVFSALHMYLSKDLANGNLLIANQLLEELLLTLCQISFRFIVWY